MAYITTQDIIDRIGTEKATRLTTDTGVTPDTIKIDRVRDGAEFEVNGYLAKRYQVPIDLAALPELATIKDLVLDVAVYRLYRLRQSMPDDVKQTRDEAIKWFEGIAKGTIVLPAAATPASANADKPVADWGSKDQNAATLRDL